MIIVFDKLLTDCIHDLDLHNRLRENKLRGTLSILLKNFAEYNDKVLVEIKKTRNCHHLNYGTRLKIIDFFEKHAKKTVSEISEATRFIQDRYNKFYFLP